MSGWMDEIRDFNKTGLLNYLSYTLHFAILHARPQCFENGVSSGHNSRGFLV